MATAKLFLKRTRILQHKLFMKRNCRIWLPRNNLEQLVVKRVVALEQFVVGCLVEPEQYIKADFLEQFVMEWAVLLE